MEQHRLLNVKETAAMLGISPKTIYNRMAPSSENPFPIPRKRVGRSVRFRLMDVEAFINEPDNDEANSPEVRG